MNGIIIIDVEFVFGVELLQCNVQLIVINQQPQHQHH